MAKNLESVLEKNTKNIDIKKLTYYTTSIVTFGLPQTIRLFNKKHQEFYDPYYGSLYDKDPTLMIGPALEEIFIWGVIVVQVLAFSYGVYNTYNILEKIIK